MRYEHNACVMNKRVVNESARNDSDGMKRSEREKRDIITLYSNFKLQTSSPAEEEEGKTETLIRRIERENQNDATELNTFEALCSSTKEQEVLEVRLTFTQ